MHSHREVLALDNRGANAFRIRVSDNWDYLRRRDFSGAVTRFAALGSRGQLDESGVAVRQITFRRNLISSEVNGPFLHKILSAMVLWSRSILGIST